MIQQVTTYCGEEALVKSLIPCIDDNKQIVCLPLVSLEKHNDSYSQVHILNETPPKFPCPRRDEANIFGEQIKLDQADIFPGHICSSLQIKRWLKIGVRLRKLLGREAAFRCDATLEGGWPTHLPQLLNKLLICKELLTRTGKFSAWLDSVKIVLSSNSKNVFRKKVKVHSVTNKEAFNRVL